MVLVPSLSGSLAHVASIKEMVESTELQWHIHSLIH